MPDDELDFPDTPHAVEAIRGKREAFDTLDDNGRNVGNAKHGVYLFYDYDGEPIYVGQTYESLRQRISRHLTNQRTDAVAMNVLDPFEVAEIEMWPFWDLEGVSNAEAKDLLRTCRAPRYPLSIRCRLSAATGWPPRSGMRQASSRV